MKKYIYFAAALAIVGAASCNKELVDNNAPEVPEVKIATLTATIDEPDTKTTLAASEDAHTSGSAVYWAAEDALSVFDGASNVKYTIKTREDVDYTPAATAVFEGTELAKAEGYYALYPYTESTTLEEGVIKGAVLPAIQTAVAGNIPAGAALAVAYTEDREAINFKNVATIIGFTLTEAADKVEFVAKGGEAIAGTIDVTINDGLPTYTVQAETGSNKVTLNNLEVGTYYFTILPDVTLTQGYELKINGYTAKTGAVEMKLQRSMTYSLGEVKILTTSIYFYPGVWDTANAQFAVKYDDIINKMNMTEDGSYCVNIPSSIESFSFLRLNPDNETNIWNKIEKVKLPQDANIYYYVNNDWNTGSWGGEKKFSIAGDFNEWGAKGADIIMSKVSAGLYMAEGVNKLTAFSQWKIRVNGEWNEAYGSSIEGIEKNKWVSVGDSNTSLAEEGSYDIYLDVKNKKLYVMQSGVSYTTAEEQKTSTTPPPAGVPVEANHIYLKPSSNWLESNAHFAAWVWKDDGNGKVYNMTEHSEVAGVYELENTGGWNKIKFLRLAPTTKVTNGATQFPSVWTQTGDLKITGNMYIVEGWDNGSFSNVNIL